jgi:hypothetical protein
VLSSEPQERPLPRFAGELSGRQKQQRICRFDLRKRGINGRAKFMRKEIGCERKKFRHHIRYLMLSIHTSQVSPPPMPGEGFTRGIATHSSSRERDSKS